MPRGVDAYDEALLQRRLWQPLDFRPALWFDASRRDSITLSGSNVTQWNDISGNGRHLVADATNRPLYSDNGGPSRRNGARVYSTSNNAWLKRAGRFSTNGLTIVGLYKKDNSLTTNSGDDRCLEMSGTTNSGESDKVGWSQGATLTEARTTLSTPWKTKVYVRSGVTNAGSYLGLFIALSHNGVAPYVATGYETGGGQFMWIGSVAEILIFGRDLSVPEYQEVEGYLAWKWGIPTAVANDHPYRNRPPLIGD